MRKNARNAASSSASEPKLAWWSSSTFVSKPISSLRLNIERSDSSASTTNHSPSPHSAFGKPSPTGAPTSHPGRKPAERSACTIIDAVVVFPCVPATAIVRFISVNSPSSSARGRSLKPRSRAASRSGFSAGTALE